MSNTKKGLRSLGCVLLMLLALAMTLSACMFPSGDTSDPSSSIISLIDKGINTGYDRYLNSNVMYRLPASVKDSDEISVIVMTKKASLLDAYEKSDREVSFTEYAYSAEAEKVAGEILAEKNALLSAFDEKGFDYETGADYKAILGGFEVVIKAGDFESLCKALGDRATAIVGDEYNPAETKLVENVVNVYDTGIFDSSSVKYDGTGTVIAVLDTGLDYNHTAFSVKNFTADRAKHGMTYADVESFVKDTKANTLYAGLTATDVYLNEKVPFAFDYADGDPDVYPMTPTASEHGTHVAGVIAGKDDVITGVAPNAQLAIMKIFSDVVVTARTSWILSALEDCVVLGVDVINMSIGTSCGFSRETDKEAVSGVYDRIRATGISMIVAASNSYNSTFGSEKNGNLGLTSNPDSATVGSPSTYEGAMSVASISGTKTPYLLYNDTIIYFTESADRVSEEKNFYDDVLPAGKDEMEIEYVTVPGVGRSADYSGLDVKGKIVLVRRGSSTFEEKANVAEAKGAAGIIVYNNVSGDIKMNVGDAKLGAASIGQDDGELLAAQASGTLKLSRKQTSGPFMSDFSSWGPTPDLGIKPEITAHGGMIYSSVPGQEYDHQSGTSMATPNVAGLTALIRQYIDESFPQIANDSVKVTALVNQLMMSTADIIFNTNGLPYAVRKQGAGLASLSNILNTDAYIITYRNGAEMDKSKIELGDDPKRTGVYELSFSIKNFGVTELSYDLSAYVMSEGVSETKTQQGETTVDELGVLFDDASVRVVSVKNGKQDDMRVSVGAGKTADVTVEIVLSEENKKYLDESFENGMYVEGFVVLNATDEKVVDLSVPYLAFYGDWTEAPLFDLDYYATNKDELDDGIDLLDKTLPDAYATRPIGSVESDYISYLGSFYFVQDPTATPIAADRKYISISNQEGAVHELTAVWAGLLRNAARMEITITEDATGEVVFEKVENDIRKSYGDGGPIYPAEIDIGFDAYEHNLKNNSTYTVTIKGYLDYGDGGASTNDCNVFTFPLTADFQAPAVTDCEFYTEYDRTAKKTRLFAKMAVYDNHYTMALQMGYVKTIIGESGDPEFQLEAFDQYLTNVYSEKNQTSYVVYELTDYIDDIRRGSVNPNSFTVAAYDYALNIATYEISLPDDFLSFYFEEESVTLSPNQVYTLAPLANPGTEWTELLTYSSSNKAVAQVVNNKLVAVGAGEAVIVARDPQTGLRASLNVTVLAEGDEGYVRYDKPVADVFELTGYLTNKAYYFVSTEDRDIGSTGDEMKFTGGYSIKMFPSEAVTLRYRLVSYFPEDTEVVVTSGNESLVKAEKVGGEWVITAQGEGYATVTVDVYLDGKATFYSQSINVEIKDPFITQGPSLSHYFGLGGVVTFPESLAITEIGQFAFSNFDYVAKDPAMGDEISEDDPTMTKQWFLGDNTITEVVIPEGVETIGSYAFANLTALEKVTLPSTLTRIEFGAFMGCTSLKTVKGIENVKFINRSAFEGCRLTSLDLKNVVAIADRAFASNTKLTSVKLGEGLQSIGSYAFSGDVALKTVTIASPIVKLGEYAFDTCSVLTAISINASVIPEGAFNECKALATVTLGKDVSVIGEYAFSNVPAKSFNVVEGNPYIKTVVAGRFLTDKEGKVLILAAPGLTGEVVVNVPTLTTVGAAAFSGNQQITSVSIPGVTVVKDHGFAYCDKLTSVILGTLTEIGDYAFFRTKITSVPSLSKVEKIGAYAFAYSSVTELTLPAGITVNEGAFKECKSLAKITVGDGVVLGTDVFRLDRVSNFTETPGTYRNEDGLLIYYYIYTSPLHELTLGENVTIGDGAFYGASELKSLTVGAGSTIGAYAFYNASSLESVKLDGVSSIGKAAFSGDVLNEFVDQNMSESYYLNDIKDYSYRYYSPVLTYVDLSGVSSIGEDCFAFCKKLTTVSLGSSITEIPARAFTRCNSLTTISLYNVTVIGENAFEESAIRKVILPKIETVGKYAFVNCKELTSVAFGGDAWIAIGEGAFSYCESLATVSGTAKLSDVGAYSFAYTAVTSMDLSGAWRIGEAAFLKKTLTDFDVKLGEFLTSIGENPFAYCRLKPFTKTLTEEWGGKTYTTETDTYDLNELIRVIDGMLYRVVPNGLELISYAGDAKNVTVADGTVRISSMAFAASEIQTVKLPSTLYAIGHKAFYDCDKLNTVIFTSFASPILEEEYDYSYWLSAENLPATGTYQYQDAMTGEKIERDGLGIVPYFMWNATDTPTVIYYGATFVDYIGRVDKTVTMVHPVNGTGYGSFIYGNYFELSAEGAAAADQTTLSAIDAIASIPANVTLADRATVEAARAAYDRITSFEQRALVYNLSVLEAAEQRIKDLDYIANGDGEAEQPEEDQTPEDDQPVVNEEKGSVVDAWILIVAIAVGAAFLALSAVLAILYLKARRGNAGNTPAAPAASASAEATETPAEEESDGNDKAE